MNKERGSELRKKEPVIGRESHAPDARVIAALCADKVENRMVTWVPAAMSDGERVECTVAVKTVR
jgi:hypothetical protein